MNLSKVLTIASVTFVTGLIFSATALAVNYPGQTNDNRPSVVGQANNPRIPAPSGLAAGKLQSCQARENGIKQRSTHLVDLVTNMESKFDAIASRVEDYYTSKVVPSGKAVPNYNTLVADIQTKKTAVQAALTTAQSDAASFSCTSSDPKTQMTKFRTDMQVVKTALKDFRTSIKNLIVAVHSVTGVENSSPKPTESSK